MLQQNVLETPVLKTALPPEPAAHGVVYTLPWTVELILDLAGYDPSKNLVDAFAVEPAAGDGAFLVQMVNRLVISCKRRGRQLLDCQDSLRAYELNPIAALTTRQTVFETLTTSGVSRPIAENLSCAWVRNENYLLQFIQQSKRESLSPFKADFVIGNPPYVRLENLSPRDNKIYRSTFSTMTGRADVYVAFYEAALRQLKPGGVCAYICADRWMLNQYGKELRRLVTANFSVETVVEMHNSNAFETEVDAYPAITVIRKTKQGAAIVAKTNGNGKETEPDEIAKQIASLRTGDRKTSSSPNTQSCRLDSWFRGSEPWPCTSPKRLALLRKLERNFAPLESKATKTKVGIGVATGADKVYVTTDRKVVEPGRLLRLAMTEDLQSGKLKWSGHYLVNPWNKSGFVNLNNYPKLKSYYLKRKKELWERNVAKKERANWYRTIDKVNISLLRKKKLYIPDIKNVIHPVLDKGLTYPHHNLYFIASEGWNLEVLGALLMSSVCRFFVECYSVKMRGGYFRLQAQCLRRIRVPNPNNISASDKKTLVKAFRTGNAGLATKVALKLYEIRQIPT